jgi:hypothetical protein
MSNSTQLNGREILEKKENLYHAALNKQNFRFQNSGREAGLAHSTGKTAV